MSAPNHFLPTTQLSVPFGEGALERLFATIRFLDPELAYFTVVAIRQDPLHDPYATLDQLPSPDSDLRPPVGLPMPPSRFDDWDGPPALGFFDARNPTEIGSFLQSLQNPLHGAANFYTYAVLVVFDPHVVKQPRPPGVLPHRPFSGAPLTRSICLVAASGHRFAFYSAADALRYLELFNAWSFRPIAFKALLGVEVFTLLPYLNAPRSTLDRVTPGNPALSAPDDRTEYWKRNIRQGGIRLPSAPKQVFDHYQFSDFARTIHHAYDAWVARGLEVCFREGDTQCHRLFRHSAFMRDRYPRLRDWLNHASSGAATAAMPRGLDTPPVQCSERETLLHIADEEMQPTADEIAAYPSFYPNYLSEILTDLYAYLLTFFSLKQVGNAEARERIADELNELLFNQGFLRALLTEIGDTECHTVTPASPASDSTL